MISNTNYQEHWFVNVILAPCCLRSCSFHQCQCQSVHSPGCQKSTHSWNQSNRPSWIIVIMCYWYLQRKHSSPVYIKQHGEVNTRCNLKCGKFVKSFFSNMERVADAAQFNIYSSINLLLFRVRISDLDDRWAIEVDFVKVLQHWNVARLHFLVALVALEG